MVSPIADEDDFGTRIGVAEISTHPGGADLSLRDKVGCSITRLFVPKRADLKRT